MILQYDIVQDAAKTGAFLNVNVNGVVLVEEEAIGEVNPPDRIIITGEVDASRIITEPARYDVTLTLVVVNAIERGWFRSRRISRSTLMG
ncbi:hypothetical protein J4G02_15495 [Candidatus Poribacteria bacterium]|nr:hypothetical protein [Candidatus Poribacteria bacterium]